LTVERDASASTWAAIDKLLQQIERRAAQIHDPSISRDVHKAITLLHNLASEIHGEDQDEAGRDRAS